MNKYKILVFFFFIIFLFGISNTYATINGFSLLGKTFCLDAGHGGVDSGAIYGNIYEKDINLVLVKKLSQKLISYGARVYLTRDGDYDLSSTQVRRKRSDLENRAKLINKLEIDMYISIHLNYIFDSRWNGLQIFYNDKNPLNENIASNLTDYLKTKYDNVRDYKNSDYYYMYNLINKPGVLIEMGFLSNPNDRYILTKGKYQDILINYLVMGIINFYS